MSVLLGFIPLAHSGSEITIPSSELGPLALALEFSRFGAEHIVFGYDHLLFLAGLTVLSTRLRDVVWIVLLFAVSYSSTLIAASLAGVAVPERLIDVIIAVSVGYVGAQIAFGGRSRWLSRDPRAPALVFGFAHGLGLSTLLQELQLSGDDLLPSAIGFNAGVEVGQVAVIGLLLGALAAAGRLPVPRPQWIPAGCALISASLALVVMVWHEPRAALAHVAPPPPPPVEAVPPQEVAPIPAEDEARYRSHVTSTRPRIPGLRARIIGRQEKLEVTWRGQPPLVVAGVEGEPMVRLSSDGVEINERSPSAYLSADRYAQVPVPADAGGDAAPRWRYVETPGSMSWYDHRTQWMRAERPEIVGDGAEAVTVFHWEVPARLGKREVAIHGALNWVPDPEAVRAQVEVTDDPLWSGIVVLGALALGGLAGAGLRRRLESGNVA